MTVSALPADVVDWLEENDVAVDADELDRVFVAAVGVLGDEYDLDAADTDRANQAVVMYCAALYKRKDSINGIAANAEWGALRVSISDPDVHRLLARWELIRFG